MTRVYAYQAALYCADCGEDIRKHADADTVPADPDDESTYDSDDYPKGPYEAGEADCPHRCESCGEFLENSLTDYGVEYVRRSVESALLEGETESVALTTWLPYYGDQVAPSDKVVRLARVAPALRYLATAAGNFPNYTGPGSHPLFYHVRTTGDCICANCVNDASEGHEAFGPIDAYDVNWEDPELYCGHCHERIESAYAEDETAPDTDLDFGEEGKH